MTCPSCGLMNPNSATNCDCGRSLAEFSRLAMSDATGVKVKEVEPEKGGVGVTLFAIFLFAAVAWWIASSLAPARPSIQATPPEFNSLPKSPPASAKVEIAELSWKKGGFDTVMVGSFVIRNGNTYAVKDIEVSCALSAPSGTILGTTSHTIYEIVEPGKKGKRFRDVNMGFIDSQSASANCSVVKVVRL